MAFFLHNGMEYPYSLRINAEKFPGVEEGTIVAIETAEQDDNEEKETEEKEPLYLEVDHIETDVRGTWHLTIEERIGRDLYGLREGVQTTVNVRVADPNEGKLSFAELSFQDQYFSRGETWRLQNDLVGRGIHITQNLVMRGMTFKVQLLRKKVGDNQEDVLSGVVSPHTKFVFRSASARFHFLFQLSAEMWTYSENGELYFEEALDGFLKTLFRKWRDFGDHHMFSVIFFTRMYMRFHGHRTTTNLEQKEKEVGLRKWLMQDSQGRLYKDYYKVVIDGSTSRDWKSLQKEIRKQFHLFPQLLQAALPGKSFKQTPSMAKEGNILEAINLCCNIHDKHYIDRDLQRTGMALVLLTAGTGVFYVDKKLSNFTKSRILINGIGADIVSVTKPPLCPVPLFIHTKEAGENNAELLSNAEYNRPAHWIQIKFFNNSEQKYKSPLETISRGASSCPPFYRIPVSVPETIFMDVPAERRQSTLRRSSGQQSVRGLPASKPKNFPRIRNPTERSAIVLPFQDHSGADVEGSLEKKTLDDIFDEHDEATFARHRTQGSPIENPRSSRDVRALEPPPKPTLDPRPSGEPELSPLPPPAMAPEPLSPRISTTFSDQMNQDGPCGFTSKSTLETPADELPIKPGLQESTSLNSAMLLRNRSQVNDGTRSEPRSPRNSREPELRPAPSIFTESIGFNSFGDATSLAVPLSDEPTNKPKLEPTAKHQDFIDELDLGVKGLLDTREETSEKANVAFRRPGPIVQDQSNVYVLTEAETSEKHTVGIIAYEGQSLGKKKPSPLPFESEIRKRSMLPGPVPLLVDDPSAGTESDSREEKVVRKPWLQRFFLNPLRPSRLDQIFSAAVEASYWSSLLAPKSAPSRGQTFSSILSKDVSEQNLRLWKSVLCPALLPLTTQLTFQQKLSHSDYQFSTYPVRIRGNRRKKMPSPLANQATRILNLKQELIMQRLAGDFQIMVREDDNYLDMCQENNIHRIAYDQDREDSLVIERWTKKVTLNKEVERASETVGPRLAGGDPDDPLEDAFEDEVLQRYYYHLWSDLHNAFVLVPDNFQEHHEKSGRFWSRMDRLCADQDDQISTHDFTSIDRQLRDMPKARRLRYTLVPSEALLPGKEGGDRKKAAADNCRAFVKWIEKISGKTTDQLRIKVVDHEAGENEKKPRCYTDSVKISLPRQWNDRPTWMRFAYDTVYDPEIFFHIEIHWLVASSVQIRQFIQEVKHAAKVNKLVIKQIPSQQLKKLQDPFHLNVTIQTVVPTGARIDILENNGFLHDRNHWMTTQYRHHTCCAVVRLDTKQKLTWITNYLDPEHPAKSHELFQTCTKELGHQPTKGIPSFSSSFSVR